MVLGFSNPTAHECSGADSAEPGGVFPSTLKILFVHTVWCVLHVYAVSLVGYHVGGCLKMQRGFIAKPH
jgi:hypothetical protein